MLFMSPILIKKPSVCIVQLGPAVENDFRAKHFQVTIDPAAVSPSKRHIRLGQHNGDELVGWFEIDVLTICEVLGELKDGKLEIPMGEKSVSIRALE